MEYKKRIEKLKKIVEQNFPNLDHEMEQEDFEKLDLSLENLYSK